MKAGLGRTERQAEEVAAAQQDWVLRCGDAGLHSCIQLQQVSLTTGAVPSSCMATASTSQKVLLGGPRVWSPASCAACADSSFGKRSSQGCNTAAACLALFCWSDCKEQLWVQGAAVGARERPVQQQLWEPTRDQHNLHSTCKLAWASLLQELPVIWACLVHNCPIFC